MKTQIWKTNVSCSAIQQMLHYPRNMVVGILNFSILFLPLFFWGEGMVFISFSQEFVLPSPCGMQSALVLWVNMHSNVKDPLGCYVTTSWGHGFCIYFYVKCQYLLLCKVSVFIFMWDVSIYFYVRCQYLLLCKVSVFTFMWGVSIFFYVKCQFLFLCEMSVFTFM